MPLTAPNGPVLQAFCKEQHLTQGQLAERSKVSVRTIQRAEQGGKLRSGELALIAQALNVSADTLCGASVALLDAQEIAQEFSCRACGAKLVQRLYVDHEYGDAELDLFECGAESGWNDRPCPKDPRFPKFSDYKLHADSESDRFYCWGQGLTPMAKAVDLPHGFGATKEAAERWVERGYIALRDGSEAADRFYPFSEHC
ncbi:MAG: helix-turn-helix transcriptional regulator [Gemmatimonadetes bacterium]|nr:helix-turn-helix transcriptional regulator [Gemmatimonadota bacterium]